MDARVLDDIARRLATSASRRGVVLMSVRGLTGLAALLAPTLGAQAETVTALRKTCRGTGEVCRRDRQCCSSRCLGHRCDCRGKGAACTVDRTCCSGRCGRGTCS